ncbi:MAG: AAA family ATPase [Spongiibacteraceae bacterium]
MYNLHFGLAEAPFSIAPDPRYLYLSEQHREALAHLSYGIGDYGGFVVLTGEVGTGKTTVCRCLLQQVPDHLDIAVIVNPKLDSHELLQTICEELGVFADEDMTSKQLLDALNDFLLSTHARGRNAILIVDEAQNLSPDVLEQLRLLTNLETNERKLLQLILLGQPELNTMLAQPSLRQLAQRITARYHLRPLTRSEVAGYIAHRLAVAGGREHLFSDAAIKAVYRYSKGIPRLVNLLCDRALLGVYAQSGSSVDAAMVRRAAREVLPPTYMYGNHWIKRAAAIFGALVVGACLAGVGIYFYRDQAASASISNAESGDWLALLKQTSADKGAALQALYSLWHADTTMPSTSDECVAADQFSCVALSSLTLNDLRTFNVPVVLQLRHAENAAPQFIVLKQLDDARARIEFNRKEWLISWSEIEKLWRGDVLMLVPAPVAQLPLQAGASGDLVAWFDNALYRYQHANERRWERVAHNGSDKLSDGVSKQAWLASHYLALREAPAKSNYDAELLAEVKRFQQAQGLPENGVIDLHNVLALSRITHTGLPALITAQNRDG